MVTLKQIQDQLSRSEAIVAEIAPLLRSGEETLNLQELIPLYNRWFTLAEPIVGALGPERLDEFREFYRPHKQRTSVTIHSYAISDAFNGRIPRSMSNVPSGQVGILFFNQVAILRAVGERAEDALRSIRGQIAADLGDAELSEARSLLQVSHRAAGAIAGVVLEGHLRGLLGHHKLSLGRKKPTLNNLNMALKAGGVLDQPTSRRIEALSDIRNLCCHKKEREPSVDEVDELIAGAGKVIKTVF